MIVIPLHDSLCKAIFGVVIVVGFVVVVVVVVDVVGFVVVVVFVVGITSSQIIPVNPVPAQSQ